MADLRDSSLVVSCLSEMQQSILPSCPPPDGAGAACQKHGALPAGPLSHLAPVSVQSPQMLHQGTASSPVVLLLVTRACHDISAEGPAAPRIPPAPAAPFTASGEVCPCAGVSPPSTGSSLLSFPLFATDIFFEWFGRVFRSGIAPTTGATVGVNQ